MKKANDPDELAVKAAIREFERIDAQRARQARIQQTALEAAAKMPKGLLDLAMNAKSAKVRRDAAAALKRYATSGHPLAAECQKVLAKLSRS